jgi:DNA-binding NarL/FixJ family response regulator
VTAARILLADDHELFREGLARLVDARSDFEVVGQANDGLEALTLARQLKPDLIVMDIRMPISDGLEATRLIHTALPEVRILMLTVQEDDDSLFEAIKAGASGYMLKNTDSEGFVRGINDVLSGEAVLPPRLATRLLQEFARLAEGPAVEEEYDLTPREREVLELVAGGATDKEIAAEFSLSVYTVKSHVRSILNKLHVANRREAAGLALKKGLVAGDKGGGARGSGAKGR